VGYSRSNRRPQELELQEEDLFSAQEQKLTKTMKWASKFLKTQKEKSLFSPKPQALHASQSNMGEAQDEIGTD